MKYRPFVPCYSKRRALFRRIAALLAAAALSPGAACAGETALTRHWLWTTARAVPRETTNEGSGYFSIIEGHDGKLYIGFHALEMVQCLAERRAGGETDIEAVRCLTGDAVWEAGKAGGFDRSLLDAALDRLESPRIPEGKRIEDVVREPVLFAIEYEDGLRANIFTLEGAVGEWAAAWRYAGDPAAESTLFWTQEARPFMHFTYLLLGIEKLLLTGRPPWPVERTLLTTGALDALLRSRRDGGRRIETPELGIRYESGWSWQQPPDPPPGRPLEGR